MRRIAIDIHAHALVTEVDAFLAGNADARRAAEESARRIGAESATHNREMFQRAYAPKFASVERRLAAMDAMRIDVQAVSIAPTATQFYYWADRELAEKIVAVANQGIAALCARRPDRLTGLGTVALQHPELAAQQLEHAMRALHLKGVIISSNVNGKELAAPELEPFWSKAEELGAFVFIHPIGCTLEARTTAYYFSNVIGNPLDTTLALAHLIFGGTFDRHPRLKVCAAHGGGYFPFYTARFDHGWQVRSEAHTCRQKPSEYLKRIYFDSLVYSAPQLEFLVRQAGASQIMLGSDFPFDMGVDDPVARLDALASLSEAEHAAILGGNAARLLSLDA